jgi:hypothetical protein
MVANKSYKTRREKDQVIFHHFFNQNKVSINYFTIKMFWKWKGRGAEKTAKKELTSSKPMLIILYRGDTNGIEECSKINHNASMV